MKTIRARCLTCGLIGDYTFVEGSAKPAVYFCASCVTTSEPPDLTLSASVDPSRTVWARCAGCQIAMAAEIPPFTERTLFLCPTCHANAAHVAFRRTIEPDALVTMLARAGGRLDATMALRLYDDAVSEVASAPRN